MSLRIDDRQAYEELCNSYRGKVEMIDNTIYCSSSTSQNHNKITGRIYSKLDDYFMGSCCEVFSEQIEVILSEEDLVKPDIFVVCNKESRGQSIITVPSLVFEVISKSNAKLDTIKKMNLYACYGIKEYCLVYQDGVVAQFILDGDTYKINEKYNKTDLYESVVFSDLKIDLSRIFLGID